MRHRKDGRHSVHEPFLLRVIRRLVAFFVLPGYGSGGAVAGGVAVLAGFRVVLGRQLRMLETDGPGSRSYQRVSLVGGALGAGLGLVVIFILYLMVFKPAA